MPHVPIRNRILAAVLLSVLLTGAMPAQSVTTRSFAHPPASAGPWVFWMWLRVQTNRAAITADLEAMKATGIRGAILYDSGVGGGMEATSRMVLNGKEYARVPTNDFAGAHFTPLPYAPMQSWTPQSRALVRWAAREAGRLGIRLVVTTGLASTSGNIPLEQGQQFLEWSDTIVTGGTQVRTTLPLPDHAVASSAMAVRSMVNETLHPGSRPKQMHTVAVLAVPQGRQVAVSDVIDLTTHTDADGHLNWNAPAGSWQILRFAYEPTGMENAWGLYTDGMSATALDQTWDVTMGELLREMTPAERRGIYGVEDDSWEAGLSTWTAGYERQFRERRGYDLIPWLPVLAGLPLGSPSEQQAVRRDYYRTTADLIAENHYGHLGEIAKRNGLKFYSEAAGPNSGQLDPQQNFSHVDVPMGEFWMPSEHRPTPDRRFLARDAASSAHVYGKPVLACESLTSVGPQWEDSFFEMKNVADQGFADGCNLLAIHNFSQSPSLTAKPGYVYFAGTHYNRNVTWWKQTPAFNAYLARVSYLLQRGVFVADALYFRGDGIGQGEQRKTEPALPAPGYDHDTVSLDALLHQVSTQDGRLLLLNGASYAMLVLPNGHMSMQALRKIDDLVQAGAVVVGPRPTALDGLADTTSNVDTQFAETIDRLWDQRAQHHVVDESAKDALARLHLPPDLRIEGVSPQGDVDWIHRRDGHTEIYFLASRWDNPEEVSATFRVHGLQPELWDPVTGEVRPARAFHQASGATTVPLHFDSRGSIVVVFRKPIPLDRSGSDSTNSPAIAPIARITTPWTVSFDPAWGGPARVTFKNLEDWTHRQEPGIRYYSGTALYRTRFQAPSNKSAHSAVFLNLGDVREVASVKLNGHDLGVLWTRPARVDITHALKPGDNRLEVTVVNLWPNRLIGDEALSPEQRRTETNAHKFNANTPLYPSGLLGPVTLEQRR